MFDTNGGENKRILTGDVKTLSGILTECHAAKNKVGQNCKWSGVCENSSNGSCNIRQLQKKHGNIAVLF